MIGTMVCLFLRIQVLDIFVSTIIDENEWLFRTSGRSQYLSEFAGFNIIFGRCGLGLDLYYRLSMWNLITVNKICSLRNTTEVTNNLNTRTNKDISITSGL